MRISISKAYFQCNWSTIMQKIICSYFESFAAFQGIEKAIQSKYTLLAFRFTRIIKLMKIYRMVLFIGCQNCNKYSCGIFLSKNLKLFFNQYTILIKYFNAHNWRSFYVAVIELKHCSWKISKLCIMFSFLRFSLFLLSQT